jgi:hypothetical protein
MQFRIVAMNSDKALDQQPNNLVKRKPRRFKPGQCMQSRFAAGEMAINNHIKDRILVWEILIDRPDRNPCYPGDRIGIERCPAVARQNPSGSLDDSFDRVSGPRLNRLPWAPFPAFVRAFPAHANPSSTN